jgi:hypothetical protein
VTWGCKGFALECGKLLMASVLLLPPPPPPPLLLLLLLLLLLGRGWQSQHALYVYQRAGNAVFGMWSALVGAVGRSKLRSGAEMHSLCMLGAECSFFVVPGCWRCRCCCCCRHPLTQRRLQIRTSCHWKRRSMYPWGLWLRVCADIFVQLVTS